MKGECIIGKNIETITNMPFESPRIFQKSESSYALSIKDLPALKEKYLRLVHITAPEAVEHILKSGLQYESQGMISSTARAYSQESGVEYKTSDPRFNQGGMKCIVMDVPEDEYRLHNDIVKSPGVISSKYIVGVVDVQKKEIS